MIACVYSGRIRLFESAAKYAEFVALLTDADAAPDPDEFSQNVGPADDLAKCTAQMARDLLASLSGATVEECHNYDEFIKLKNRSGDTDSLRPF